MSYKDEDFERRDESNETDETGAWEGAEAETGDDENAPGASDDSPDEAAQEADDEFHFTDDVSGVEDEENPSLESSSLEEALDAALADAWEVGDAEDASATGVNDERAASRERGASSQDDDLHDLDDLSDGSFYDPTKPLLSHEAATASDAAVLETGAGIDGEEAHGFASRNSDTTQTSYAADDESGKSEDEALSGPRKFFRAIRDFFKPGDKNEARGSAATWGDDAASGSTSSEGRHASTHPRAGQGEGSATEANGSDLSDQYFSADDFIDLDELQAEEETELDLEDDAYDAETTEASEQTESVDHAFATIDGPDSVNYPDYTAYAQKTHDEEKSSGGLLNRLSNAKVTTRVALALTGLVLLFFIAISIWRATTPDPLRPTTMENTAELLRRSLYEQDFDAYRGLFKESHRPEILETDFRELSRIATSDASSSNYSILRMSNGRMLILGMEKDEASGEFRVLYVLEVPTSMKELFTDRTLGNEEEKQLPIPLGQFPATQEADERGHSEVPGTETGAQAGDELSPDEDEPLEETPPYEKVGPQKPVTAEDEVKEALAPYESPYGPLKDEEEKLNEAARKEAAKDSSDPARDADKKSD